MPSMHPTPPAPRVARRLLGWFWPSDSRSAVLDELDDEYARFVAPGRGRRATLWYWRQVVMSIPAACLVRIRRALAGTVADLQHGWRVWRRSPGAALSMVVLPALGIAGVTSVFGPLHALVLSPLPFPDPDRLARIGGDIPMFSSQSGEFVERDRLRAIFSNVAAYSPNYDGGSRTRLSTGDRPRQAIATLVSPEFFETIGVEPRLGRGLAGERVIEPVMVVSHRVWQADLHAAPDIVGKAVQLGQVARTVIGVMPEDFDFPAGTDIWIPIKTGFAEELTTEFVGRLRADVSFGQGAAWLTGLREERADLSQWSYYRKSGPVLQPLHEFLRGDRRPLLWAMSAVAGLFLLLACAGVVNLLLAQGVRRRSETVVRLALGAGRWRVMRQLVAETMVVVAAGGLAGLWLSSLASQWLLTRLPELERVQMLTPMTVAVVAVLAVAVALVCSLLPALHASATDANAALKAGVAGRSDAVGRRASVRELLAGAQLVVALAMLVGTSVLLRSLSARLDVRLGVETGDVAVFSTELSELPSYVAARQALFRKHGLETFGSYGPRNAYDAMQEMGRLVDDFEASVRARNTSFFDDARRRLAALPSVEAAGLLDPVPFSGDARREVEAPRSCWAIDWRETDERPPSASCIYGRASEEAFAILAARLVAGRWFSKADIVAELSEEAPAVAIVNQALADRLWPGESPLGKPLYEDYSLQRTRTVVGVVANFHQAGDVLDATPARYQPFAGEWERGSFVVKLRPGTPLPQFEREANAVIGELAPEHPRVPVEALSDLATASLANMRLALMLVSAFAVLGTIVAGLGVYAVATLMAAARMREMGIRLALGARAGEVGRLALWRGVRLGIVAVPLGLVAGWILTRSLSRFLYEVGTADPISYLTSAALLGAVVLGAGLLPALRSASADPTSVLRQE